VVVVVAVLAAGGAVAAVVLRSSSGGHHGAPTVTSTSVPAATVTSGVAPWTLRAPVDAEVVLVPPTASAAGAPLSSSLEVFGGSTTGSRPASGIFTLDTTNGTLVHVANLTTALSDAAGAVVNGQAVIFGGANPTPVATVQAFAATGTGTGGVRSPVPTATVIGSLPEPRAGAAALTVGSTTYLLGGANGPTPDPSVLATTDARSYSVVATLPVPVSFPAAAAVGTKLYVFGGQALSGAGAGQPVTTVQMVDLASHRTKVVGRLPAPLMGAAAFSLGGKVFVAGGDSSAGASAPATSVSSPAGQTTGAPGTQTSGTIWAFNPAKVSFVSDGLLQSPVARAGVSVLGSTAWFVGGASGGVPTSIVQSVTSAPTPSRSG
jgi:hypothetical protein